MSAAAAAALKVAKPSKKTLAATAAAEEEERAAAEAATKLAEEEALKAIEKQEPTKRTFLVEAELDTVLELPALPSDLRALVSYIKNMLALAEEDSISKGYLLVCVWVLAEGWGALDSDALSERNICIPSGRIVIGRGNRGVGGEREVDDVL